MISVRARAVALALAVAMAAGLAGCAGAVADADTASTTPAQLPAPTVSRSVTPTPSPTPTVDAADPATWLVTFDGIGPMKAGVALDDVPGELAAFRQIGAPEEQCAAYTYRLADTLKASAWGGVGDHTHAVHVGVGWTGSDDAPGAADIAQSPRTERGIGIGSTIAELQAAYPELAVTTAGAAPTYGIGDGSRWILFRDVWAGGTVSAIQVGTSTQITNEIC